MDAQVNIAYELFVIPGNWCLLVLASYDLKMVKVIFQSCLMLRNKSIVQFGPLLKYYSCYWEIWISQSNFRRFSDVASWSLYHSELIIVDVIRWNIFQPRVPESSLWNPRTWYRDVKTSFLLAKTQLRSKSDSTFVVSRTTKSPRRRFQDSYKTESFPRNTFFFFFSINWEFHFGRFIT